MRSFFTLLVGLVSAALYAQVTPLKISSDKARIVLSNLRDTPSSITQWVNPLIGTGGHGHTFPGATVPFGMVQLSPDTRKDGWDGCGGYHYSDTVIYGFSHTHLSGTGVPDYADLLITPVCGNYPKNPRYKDAQGYGSAFSHSSEKAEPGYYTVHLKEGNIAAELTATPRCGIHKYTFNGEGNRYIVLDLDYRDKVINADFSLISPNEIRGFRESEGWAKHQYFYFSLKTSAPYEKMEKVTENGQHRLVLTFPKSTKTLELYVGISSVDEHGAARNLEMETDGLNFQSIRQNARMQWENELKKITIEDENKEQKVIFYTALYHSLLAPNIFSDVDGRYRGRDLALHTIDQGMPQYTVFSLWDTYRATHPLFCLIDQKRTLAFINTFLRQFDQGGDLPVWELAANETECMIGFHSASVITDAYVKGIRGFDAEKALKAMMATSEMNEFGKKPFREQGMIASDQESESVSKALEYSYDHFCVSEFARQLHQESNTRNTLNEVARRHRNYSYSFINHFDPSNKFMRARRGAQWLSPFDPTEVNFNFTEANSWQYSLYAPQHPELLTNLIGGKKALSTWLDQMFYSKLPMSGRDQADITGLIGQYAHGNEPSHHVAYLYNYSSTPWKTQRMVDSIQRTMYRNTPDGLAGNEDCGQMSSWYVLSALGIYPIAPGTPYYEIGHPIFSKATMKLENGSTLSIVKKGSGIFIDEVKLNGQTIQRLSHKDMMGGGTLEFFMRETATKESSELDMYEITLPNDWVPLPFIASSESIFEDSLRIEMDVIDLDKLELTVEYSLSGEEDKPLWRT
ncbi:MAG: GH92 family glycosyl hydrolase [Bacteroidota bacterium]